MVAAFAAELVQGNYETEAKGMVTKFGVYDIYHIYISSHKFRDSEGTRKILQFIK
jgi:hypothetical protein